MARAASRPTDAREVIWNPSRGKFVGVEFAQPIVHANDEAGHDQHDVGGNSYRAAYIDDNEDCALCAANLGLAKRVSATGRQALDARSIRRNSGDVSG